MRKRIEAARKTAAYRLGRMEAIALVTSGVMSACQQYVRIRKPGKLAAYLMQEMEMRRESAGIEGRWDLTTAADEERRAEGAMRPGAIGASLRSS